MRRGESLLLRAAVSAVTAILASPIAFGQVSLGLSSTSGSPGSSVTLYLSSGATAGNQPAAVRWTLNYSTLDFSSITVTAASAATAAGKTLLCNNANPGTSTCAVYGLNSTAIANGVVATVALVISSATLNTSSVIQFTGGQAASPAGIAVSANTTGATVTIVQPQAPSLSSLSCIPTSVTPPASSTCLVTLTSAALTGGALVGLSSNNLKVTVPASVTVPAGATTASFTASTSAVTSDTLVTITATLAAVSRTAQLTLQAPAVNLAPAPVSVSPSAGSGSSQTFSFVFSDGNGYADIAVAQIDIAPTLMGSGACFVYFQRTSNQVWLATDAGSSWMGPLRPGASGTVQNGQCTLNAAGSSSSSAGNNLTLNLALSFHAGLTGPAGIYMYVQDNAGLNSGWRQMGAWTVPLSGTNLAPAAVSVTPGAGSGTSQTFSFVFSDDNAYGDITVAQIDIAPTLSASGACYVYFQRRTNRVWLADDAGTSWLGPLTLGASGTAQNGQCMLNAASSSAAGAGNNLTLSLAVSFQAGLAGLVNTYMYVQDTAGLTSGWQQMGTWTVSPGGTNVMPAVVSVSPNAGSGTSQTFSFVFSDGNGYGDIAIAQVDIAPALAAAGACYVYFQRTSNQIWLSDDSGTNWVGPLTLGGSGTLQNSQCALNAAVSSYSGAGNNLTLNLAVTFGAGLTGSVNTYMQVEDTAGLNSGWQQAGTWTVR